MERFESAGRSRIPDDGRLLIEKNRVEPNNTTIGGVRETTGTELPDVSQGKGESVMPESSPLRRRDRRFILQAIDDYHDLVYRVAQRVHGNVADAEDTTQEVFLKLVSDAKSLRAAREPRAWLTRVVVNTARSRFRSDVRRQEREEAWAVTQHQDGSRFDEIEELESALSELPEELRMPVVLHYQEGFKYREIAEALDCPLGTVATRVSTAKKRLESRLKGGFATPLAGFLFAARPEVPAGTRERLSAKVQERFVELGTTSKVGPALMVGIVALLIVGVGWIAGSGLGVWGSDDSGDRAVAWIASSTPDAIAAKPESANGSGSQQPENAEGVGDGNFESGSTGETGNGDPRWIPTEGTGIYGWVEDLEGVALPGVTVRFSRDQSSNPRGQMMVPESSFPTTITDEHGYYFLQLHGWYEEETAESDAENERAQVDADLKHQRIQTELEALDRLAAERAVAAAARGEARSVESSTRDESSTRTDTWVELAAIRESARRDSATREMADSDEQLRAELSVVHEQLDRDRLGADARREMEARAQALEAKSYWRQEAAASIRSGNLILFGPGVEPRRISMVAPSAGEVARRDFQLHKAESLIGIVTDGQGEPLSGVEIRIVGYFGPPIPSEIMTAVTDASGRYEMLGLPASVYSQSAFLKGYVRAQATGLTGSPERWVLSRAGGIRFEIPQQDFAMEVQLIQQDRALQRKTVPPLGSQYVDVDRMLASDGRGEFLDLMPGEYTVRIVEPKSRQPFDERAVVVSSGEPLKLSLRPSQLTDVFCTVAESTAAQDVSVVSLDFPPLSFPRRTTHRVSPGVVRSLGSLPRGRYLLLLSSRGRSRRTSTWQEVQVSGARADVVLSGSDRSRVPLVIRGQDQTGSLLSRYTVTVSHGESGARLIQSSGRGEDVRVSLPEGRYRVAVAASNFVTRVVETEWLRPGQPPIVVPLQATATRDAIAELFEGADSVTLESVTLRGLLGLASESSIGEVRATPELDQSGILDSVTIHATQGRIESVLRKAARRNGLVLEVAGRHLVIDLPMD